jgi:hypothetical protein
MKRLMLAVATTAAIERGFCRWIFAVGNRATSKCDIVSTIRWSAATLVGDGPYKSVKTPAARSTISACPKEAPPPAACEGSCDKDKKG